MNNKLGEVTPLLHKPSDSDQEYVNRTVPTKFAWGKLFGIIGVIVFSIVWILLGWQNSSIDIPLATETVSLPQSSSRQPRSVKVFSPFSIMDPRKLSFSGVTRPGSTPGQAFRSLKKKHLALPTNSWSQNLMYVYNLN